MGALAGYNGRVATGLGSVALPCTRWQLTWKQELVDATTTDNVVFLGLGNFVKLPQYLPGWHEIDVEFDAFWDSSVDPFDGWAGNPAAANTALFPRNIPLRVALFLDKAGGGAFLVWVLVESTTFEGEVRGVFKYTVRGKVQGGSTLSVNPPGNKLISLPNQLVSDNPGLIPGYGTNAPGDVFKDLFGL